MTRCPYCNGSGHVEAFVSTSLDAATGLPSTYTLPAPNAVRLATIQECAQWIKDELKDSSARNLGIALADDMCAALAQPASGEKEQPWRS